MTNARACAALAAALLLAISCSKRHAPERTVEVDLAAINLRFVAIPAGSFEMGTDSSRSPDQGPRHRVVISRPFELQATELTQAQWKAVMGNDPAHFVADDLPVEQVSWNDVEELVRRLNEIDPGKNYRLPTEAEWEYACLAGTPDGNRAELDSIAWFHRNSGGQTHPAGTKQPNAWGLYDMLGNVWELTADWKDSYPAAEVTDPAGPKSGYYRVSRGGSWFDTGPAVTCTFRSSPEPTYRGSSLGFRLARNASSTR